jgi:hypothetical protein
MSRILLFLIVCVVGASQAVAVQAQTSSDWYMAGANPQRTSWVDNQVNGDLRVEWYLPIKSYIDIKSQPILVNGVVYIATSKGLLAINAENGSLIWRYDTQMPLGHSPTVVGNRVYVSGYDGRIHALNSSNGQQVWVSSSAGAAFEVSPVVVNNRVYAGNRNGYFYAFDTNTGYTIWQYPAIGISSIEGGISQSPAYDQLNNTLYFAANDMYAYALYAGDNPPGGNRLRWKSANKLPGQDFRNYWPVVYNNDFGDDWVVFGSNMPTRGADSWQAIYKPILYPNGVETGYPNGQIGPSFITSPSDPRGGNWPWPLGSTVMDMSNLLNLLMPYPHLLTHTFLNKDTGVPSAAKAPFTFEGNNGNGAMYPPVVMPDGVIYQMTTHRFQTGTSHASDIVGWLPGTPYVRLTQLTSVVDEPQEFSGGGNLMFRRRYFVVGDSKNIITSPGQQTGLFWNTSPGIKLLDQMPGGGGYGYKEAIYKVIPCSHAIGYCEWYDNASVNGVYGNGRPSPLIPHRGKLYLIDHNLLIAFGSNGETAVELPAITENPGTAPFVEVNQTTLNQKLTDEIQKILAVYESGDINRFLLPGFFDDGQNMLRQHDYYFKNPGETLLTLSLAYPHLSENLKSQLDTYLEDYYNTFFGTTLYTSTGWTEGTTRNSMMFPPHLADLFATLPKSTSTYSWTWRYPQYNIYALYKYAQINPDIIQSAYSKAKANIEYKNLDAVLYDPVTYRQQFTEYPFEVQMYMAGYQGFLGLYELAGRPPADQTLANQVQQYLNTYLNFRVSSFSKDSFWFEDGIHHNRKFNVAVNFMWLTPDLGRLLGQNIRNQISQAVAEYQHVAPFWFIKGYQGGYMETAVQQLFDSPAIFQAKAWILGEPQQELIKYLDTPMFARGDLFYIQNLIALIEAPSDPSYTPVPTLSSVPTSSVTPTPACGPAGDVDCNGTVNLIDLSRLLSKFGQQGSFPEDVDKNGTVNLIDLSILLSNFGKSG